MPAFASSGGGVLEGYWRIQLAPSHVQRSFDWLPDPLIYPPKSTIRWMAGSHAMLTPTRLLGVVVGCRRLQVTPAQAQVWLGRVDWSPRPPNASTRRDRASDARLNVYSPAGSIGWAGGWRSTQLRSFQAHVWLSRPGYAPPKKMIDDVIQSQTRDPLGSGGDDDGCCCVHEPPAQAHVGGLQFPSG